MTPKLGILSADTWTVAVLYLRNLLLNWLVLLPLVMAVLLIPRLAHDFTTLFGSINYGAPLPAIVPVLIAGMGGLALLFGFEKAIAARRFGDGRSFTHQQFLRCVLFPIYAAAAPRTLAVVQTQAFHPPLWGERTASLIAIGAASGAVI